MVTKLKRSPEQAAESDARWIGALAVLLLGTAASSDIGYGDAGELGTAAVVLGVAHPTGFAIDLLWLKAASLLPLGHLAFRLNLATALTGGVAIGLCAAITGLLITRVGVREQASRRLGVLAAVTSVGGFATFLIATRAVEVYALALCAVLFGLYAVLRGEASERIAGVLVLLLGLSPGLHVTAGLYVLGFAVAYALSRAHPLRWLGVRTPMLVAGALVIAYLPLASLRNPALDWGDPESVRAILLHLTADRIRSAYRADMFGGGDTRASLELFGQLAVFATLLGAMLLASMLRLRDRSAAPNRASQRTHIALFGIALLGLIDLAYAEFVNPMGVRDFQVGHVGGASLAILGGISIAWLLSRLDLQTTVRRSSRRWARGAALLASLSHLSIGFDSPLGDGRVLGELFGSGGLVARLPPRAVFLCTSDDACSAAMFALHVERVRPDMDVAPAQHLWDRTIVRRIEGMGELVVEGLLAEQRGERAQALVRSWIDQPTRRPIALEAVEIATRASARSSLMPLGISALLTPGTITSPATMLASVGSLDTAYRARFFGLLPTTERDRTLWSRVYGELGAVAIGTPAAVIGVQQLQRAVSMAPERASGWTNLGVALEHIGNIAGALDATKRAVTVDPARPTPWVNLARLASRTGDIAAARKVIEASRLAGIYDARIEALARQLAVAPAVAPRPPSASDPSRSP